MHSPPAASLSGDSSPCQGQRGVKLPVWPPHLRARLVYAGVFICIIGYVVVFHGLFSLYTLPDLPSWAPPASPELSMAEYDRAWLEHQRALESADRARSEVMDRRVVQVFFGVAGVLIGGNMILFHLWRHGQGQRRVTQPLLRQT